ncbi:MAG: hypothetical protein K2N18_01905, partial [Clostridia bacterium]|nr:hypothetical protein [Clostridia bacterium]
SERINLNSGNQADKSILDKCSIEYKSSNESILTVGWNPTSAEFILTPVTSGKAYVYYTLKLFGEEEHVISDSFAVDVIMLVTLPNIVYVSGTVQVQLSTLTTALKSASEVTKGKTFTLVQSASPYHQMGTLKQDAQLPYDDGDYIWDNYDGYHWKENPDARHIPFLRNTFVDDTATYIGVSMLGEYTPSANDPTNVIYRIVAVFEDADGVRFEVAFQVLPAEQSLTLNGRVFRLEINKADKTISITNRDDGIEAARAQGLTYTEDGFIIPIKYIKTLMSSYDPNKDDKEYKFINVQAMSSDGLTSYEKYVELVSKGAEEDEFYIVPLYPTIHSDTGDCNIRVSVRATPKVAGAAKTEITVLNFSVTVTGIKTVLDFEEYKTVLIAAFFGSLALLVIIFFIRMGIYWKKKAEQRRI